HEVGHIIPEKHRGMTTEATLCLSCFDCNRFKGSDFASFDADTGEITSLFNPRRARWTDHFELDGALIKPKTAIGRVTVFILQINDQPRITERATLIDGGRYPPPEFPIWRVETET